MASKGGHIDFMFGPPLPGRWTRYWGRGLLGNLLPKLLDEKFHFWGGFFEFFTKNTLNLEFYTHFCHTGPSFASQLVSHTCGDQ